MTDASPPPCLLLDYLLQLSTLHIHGVASGPRLVGVLFCDILIGEDIGLIFEAGKDHGNERRSRVEGTMWCEPVEQRSDFSFGSQIALSVTFLGHLESHLHSFD